LNEQLVFLALFVLVESVEGLVFELFSGYFFLSEFEYTLDRSNKNILFYWGDPTGEGRSADGS